ncbi:hypothetical protein SMICM17S_12193 [Streptomyces microflavus]
MGEAAAGGRGGGYHGCRHGGGLAAARPRDAEGAAAGGFFGVAALLGAGLVALFRVFRFLVRLRDLGPRRLTEEFRGLDAAPDPVTVPRQRLRLRAPPVRFRVGGPDLVRPARCGDVGHASSVRGFGTAGTSGSGDTGPRPTRGADQFVRGPSPPMMRGTAAGRSPGGALPVDLAPERDRAASGRPPAGVAAGPGRRPGSR